jgi:hypothetical protein
MLHAPHVDCDWYEVPPTLKVPTPQSVPADEPTGQKAPGGHASCVVLVVARGHT